jgi:hypothetical protein
LGVAGEVNLVWDNYQGFPFSYNRILRDSTNTGNWQVIDSVAATNFTYTDLTPPDSVRYLIEVVPGSPCNPTRSIINTSRSNIKTQAAAGTGNVGIEQVMVLTAEVYPNPANGILNIVSPFAGNKTSIEVYDALGKMIQSFNVNTNKFQIALHGWSEGIYFFRISDNGMVKAKGKFQVQN